MFFSLGIKVVPSSAFRLFDRRVSQSFVPLSLSFFPQLRFSPLRTCETCVPTAICLISLGGRYASEFKDRGNNLQICFSSHHTSTSPFSAGSFWLGSRILESERTRSVSSGAMTGTREARINPAERQCSCCRIVFSKGANQDDYPFCICSHAKADAVSTIADPLG